MNKELEKKFDRTAQTRHGGHDEILMERLKSFIDTHFIAKEDMKEFWDAKKVLFPKEFKQDLLSMVGEDRKVCNCKHPHCPLFHGVKDEKDCQEHVVGALIQGYNQAKQEIRERINGRIHKDE